MIGVFDSGIGGLTVVKALRRRLPDTPIIYLGDTAHVPYGNKSRETIRRFSLANLEFLLAQRVHAVVIACNTSTAVGLPELVRRSPVPVIGVIEPGSRQASRLTRSGRIGVIGTLATIASGAYTRAILKHLPSAVVVEQACPLFVPLVEEGWHHSSVTRTIATRYLAPLKTRHIDTLILGCTHYPLLKPMIREIMGHRVQLVDSADATASAVAMLLGKNARGGRGPSTFYVTDLPQRFARVGRRFLGQPLGRVRIVTIPSRSGMRNR